MSLETAILLPFVIIAVLSLGFILKINSAVESAMSIATDEARLLAVESYTDVGKVKSLTFNSKLEKRISNENSDLFDVDVKHLRYMYNSRGLNKLISFDLSYDMKAELGLSMAGDIHIKEHVLTRAFVGQDDYRNDKGFALLEEEEDSEKCWVFPRAGEKHHKKDCRYISNLATKTTLTTRLCGRFKPCKLCNAQALEKGASVYCYFKTGETYHRQDCKAVQKYVVEMEKSEAEKRGYGPCSICGG